jgi:AcrR family transcriptional regulator
MSAGSRFVQRKRQDRGERRIADIVSAASSLFGAHGFDGTTMNAIAQRANLSIGSLYQYFPDKDAIVDAVADSYIHAWDFTINALLASAEEMDLAKLARRSLQVMVDFDRRHAAIRAFLHAEPAGALDSESADSGRSPHPVARAILPAGKVPRACASDRDRKPDYPERRTPDRRRSPRGQTRTVHTRNVCGRHRIHYLGIGCPESSRKASQNETTVDAEPVESASENCNETSWLGGNPIACEFAAQLSRKWRRNIS